MILQDQDIVIFGLPRYDSELESTNYTTAKLLASNNRVYYVENPYTLIDALNGRESAKFKKRKKFFSPFSTSILDTDTPHFYIVVPPVVFSINFLPEGWLFRKLLVVNEFLIGNKIRRILRKRRVEKYLFINSFNFHYPNVVRFLSPLLTVYHCLDPLIIDFDRHHGVVSEQMLIEKSDIVLCSSRQLYKENLVRNPKTFFVPNAADLTHSRKSLDVQLPLHELFKNLSGPIVGYFGAIERRIDYLMLQEVVEKNLDKTFVMVGPVIEDYLPAELLLLDNIIFPGSVPYSELPSVLKGFDVAIIPFKKDAVSATIFPLKLFEYLGAGKPVVCTDFNPDLKEFTAGQVAFCSNAQEFSEAIHTAMLQNSPDQIAARIHIASQNTWDKRVDEIGEILSNALKS